jgi:hypothetical protein
MSHQTILAVSILLKGENKADEEAIVAGECARTAYYKFLIFQFYRIYTSILNDLTDRTHVLNARPIHLFEIYRLALEPFLLEHFALQLSLEALPIIYVCSILTALAKLGDVKCSDGALGGLVYLVPVHLLFCARVVQQHQLHGISCTL